MKYSLHSIPTQHSTDYNSTTIDNSNPIEFYKMAKSREYEIPSYETVSATGLFNQRRKPLSSPNSQETTSSQNSYARGKATYPKTTYPKHSIQSQSTIPNKPEVLYHEPYNQFADVDTYPVPTVNSYSMVTPELDQSVYHMPVGVPLMQLYGYDSYDDAEKDYDYMKQLFPVAAKKILFEISDECDKLEYDGSCMFDEYPDRVYLSRIIERIYEKTKHLFEDTVHAAEFEEEYARRGNRRPDKKPNNSNNPIKDMIEILFFHEILNRRRRFRGRRHWY